MTNTDDLRPRTTVLPAGSGIHVPGEQLAELNAGLRLLGDIHAGRVPPGACRQPRPSRTLLEIQAAAKQGATDVQALKHRALAAATGNTGTMVDVRGSGAGSAQLAGDTGPGARWVTTEQAAELAGRSARRWRQLAAAGDVTAYRSGGRWLLDRHAVTAYAAERHGA